MKSKYPRQRNKRGQTYIRMANNFDAQLLCLFTDTYVLNIRKFSLFPRMQSWR
jgi:hypothetical protein